MATGRFAPSPTGILHLGNLRTALASWLSARSTGSPWIIRMEDVDGPRCRRDLGEDQLRDLARLGLESDVPVIWQSDRTSAYLHALQQLHDTGRLYPCACSRKDLARLASAPHQEDGLRPYDGLCRHVPEGPFRLDALRLQIPAGPVAWMDRLLGSQTDNPAQLTGDPLLCRRDGCFAYHLAVVVDDAAQGVEEVVRGQDLRSITATQIRIQEALGLPRPAYAHLGMVTAPDGTRLGKRDGALGLDTLASRGIPPEDILGWLGWSLGCLDHPRPVCAADLVPTFRWEQVPSGPLAIPASWL